MIDCTSPPSVDHLSEMNKSVEFIGVDWFEVVVGDLSPESA